MLGRVLDHSAPPAAAEVEQPLESGVEVPVHLDLPRDTRAREA